MQAHQDTAAGGQALAGLLRAATGSSGQRIDRALQVLVEQLGMNGAYVSQFRDAQRVVTHSVFLPGGPDLPVGTTHPVEETLCHLIATGELPALVGDAAADPVLAQHPHTAAFGVAAHAGLPLHVDGRLYGALCCAATTAVTSLNPRDEATLAAVAGYIAELLTDRTPEPAEPGLQDLAAAVAAGHDLQALTRPLLQLLQQITGLDSTFMSLVDADADELVIAYAHNGGALAIGEGVTTSWRHALCRRALDNTSPYVADVPAAWPDAVIAQQLGITSFASVPIRDAHDTIVGTLCAASSTHAVVDTQNLAIMSTFAQLLGAQLARETAHHLQAAQATLLEQRMNRLRETAERDALTGLSNRAGIHRWLRTALDSVETGDQRLAVAFIDLDRFKTVNDTHGHAAGDEVLRRLAASLSRTGRPGDLHGRLGGDEFVVAALLPADACMHGWTQRVRAAAVADLDQLHITGSVGVITCEPGTPAIAVEHLLDRADQAMYQAKRGSAGAKS